MAALLAGLGACGDDDTNAGLVDSGVPPHDAAVVPSHDASQHGDAAVTQVSDAAIDGGIDCSVHVPFPSAFGFSPSVDDTVRLPLDCSQGCETLAAFSDKVRCDELSDGGVDDGVGDDYGRTLTRSQGCGTVQFTTDPPAWPRYHNFDMRTGMLIGLASADDIQEPPCNASAYVRGEIRESCAGEVLTQCRWR